MSSTPASAPARGLTEVSRLPLREQIAWAREESQANRQCGRRVRYEARDALGVIFFSAGASTGFALIALVMLTLLTGPA